MGGTEKREGETKILKSEASWVKDRCFKKGGGLETPYELWVIDRAYHIIAEQKQEVMPFSEITYNL